MNDFFIDKNIIKKSFSMAASTYDASSKLQRDVADYLIKILAGFQGGLLNSKAYPHYHNQKKSLPYEKKAPLVLDIGCGTGALSNSLACKYPHINFFGCDFSLPMLIKARERFRGKNINLLSSDCEFLPFRNSQFDQVISSLTYQWIPDIESAFSEVWRILKPKGYFIFSIPGPRTLEELRASYKKTEETLGKKGFITLMKFQKIESISLNLKNTGFENLLTQNTLNIKYYKNLWELLKTLKATGAAPPFPNGGKSLARGLILKETAKIYQKNYPSPCGTGISAVYHIIFAVAQKKM